MSVVVNGQPMQNNSEIAGVMSHDIAPNPFYHDYHRQEKLPKLHEGIFGSVFRLTVISAGLVALGYWASVAEIDQVSRANGQMIALAKTQTIQAARDGVLESLFVKEGQAVKKGQVLAVLDKSQEEAAYEDGKAKVAALEAQLIRLRAEVFNKSLSLSSFGDIANDYPEFVSNQLELYERRQRALNSEISTYSSSLALAQEELRINSELERTKDVGKSEILRLRRQVSELQGQINTKKSKYFQDAQTEMTKAEEELSTQKQSLIERTTNFERTEITAPTDGQVKSITINTIGARVRPGEAMLDIVPTGDMVVEVKLKPVDVSYVREGLHVNVKLDAYDYTVFGAIKGDVQYVSPDALMEKTPQGETPYYRVQIKLSQASINERNKKNKKPIVIQPGMTATAEIQTGQQTILNYLTKPFIKTLDQSMGER